MIPSSILALLALCSSVQSLSTVVYGPQSREMLLLTSKVAARQSLDTSFICASDTQEGCRRLMYGDEYAKAGIDEEGNAKPVSEGVDIAESLLKADSMVIICEQQLETKAIETLLNVATPSEDNSGVPISKIVLLSRMGVTKAKTGFFGGGGVDAQIAASENALRKIAGSRNIPLCIVRAGNLKGGGSPYRPEDEEAGADGVDFNFGLDGVYYNTIIDVVEANVAMAYDKYTLGASCVRGDPIQMPNGISLFGSKSSFEPLEYETNRIVAAEAVVAALQSKDVPDFSVSAAKGTKPPSPEEWATTLQRI